MSRGSIRGLEASAVVLASAMLARAIVVAWAHDRFAPVADATFYDVIATRVADGHGYTWLWPDGVVTYAAHYPVGYPAILGAFYWLVGSEVGVGMWVNAIVGALGAVAVHRIVRRVASDRAALGAGLVAAFHPALLLYTPALMTEGVVGSLLAVAVLAAIRLRERTTLGRLACLAVVFGVLTLVRPQSLALAPLFGGIAWATPDERRWARWRGAVFGGLAVTALTVAMCAPWTIRNCVRMDRCALVSVNGGWNLLIGAGEHATGAWSPVDVPPACRTVFHEAEKDVCFEREARRMIADRPLRWIALAPAKLAATFDYTGAGPWYLHTSNPEAFSERTKEMWGAAETLLQRILLLAALVTATSGRGGGRRLAILRWGLAGLGAVFAVQVHAWITYVALALALAVSPPLRGADGRPTPLLGLAASTIGMTVLVHAVFFGSGRYSLMVFPIVIAVAFAARARPLSSPGPDFDRRHPAPAS